MNTALNRTTVALLTNKSGGSVAYGDVVIIDATTASSFTTTTTGGYVNGLVGVVLEPNGIASNAVGSIAVGGFVPKINLSSSASLGDLFFTDTVAKQAVRHAAPMVAGDFGIVLEASATPKAFLFNLINQGGGGVTNAEYLTSAAHDSLSAEVVIPGLAGSADIAGAGGAGVAYEFDSGASPLTWSAAVDTEDVDSTVKSHLYIQDNGASETLGTYSWSPAGAFDIRMKLKLGGEVGTSASSIIAGLVVGDSAMNNRVVCGLSFVGSSDTWIIQAYTYVPSSYTQRGANNVVGTNEIYLRIVRDGSNNVSFYYSRDGNIWLLIVTQAFTFTAQKAGVRISPSSLTETVAIDWIRSNV